MNFRYHAINAWLTMNAFLKGVSSQAAFTSHSAIPSVHSFTRAKKMVKYMNHTKQCVFSALMSCRIATDFEQRDWKISSDSLKSI